MVGAPDTSSAQGWVSATFDAAQAAGSSVEILAADGTLVDPYTAVKDFSSLIYSSVDIDSGAEYQVVVDGGTTTATAGSTPAAAWAAAWVAAGADRAGRRRTEHRTLAPAVTRRGGRLSATAAPCGELPGDRQAAFRCLSGSRRTLSA